MGNLNAGSTRYWFQVAYNGVFEEECTLPIQCMYGIGKKIPAVAGFCNLRGFTSLTIGMIIVRAASYAITSGRGKADYCEEQGDD
jgi:hypothetical protein